jgi:hypothetical protein
VAQTALVAVTPIPPPPGPLFTADFNSGTDGFSYSDNTFRGASQSNYASGSRVGSGGFSGGALSVVLGGSNGNSITNMSGGWARTFTLAQPAAVVVSFRYNLTMGADYDADEYSQVLASVDGALHGNPPNDYIAQLVGNGNGGPDLSTGWQLFQVSVGTLQAGTHTLIVGGFNNKKTSPSESTTILIDDVSVTGGTAPPPPPPPPGLIFEASFNSGQDSFGYSDDTFRGTNQSNYASGSRIASGGFSGGALSVALGGVNNNTITNMSGGWARTFTLTQPTAVALSFRYNLTQDGSYEDDEYSQVLASLDGVLYGAPPNDHAAQITGNGNGGSDLSTGWQLFEVSTGTLPAGTHTLIVGGFNNKKTSTSESTTILIDDVSLTEGEAPPPPPPTPSLIFEANFNSGQDSFGYSDNTFRGTNQPNYASGSRIASGGFSGGALSVVLGGVNNNTITNMSGGWTRSFTLTQPTAVVLSFRYNLTQDASYESNEYSQALASVDGVLRGAPPNDYVAQIAGNGNGGPDLSTDWQVFQTQLGTLPAGTHTVVLGGFNNQKTSTSESTTILIDDVSVSVAP